MYTYTYYTILKASGNILIIFSQTLGFSYEMKHLKLQTKFNICEIRANLSLKSQYFNVKKKVHNMAMISF